MTPNCHPTGPHRRAPRCRSLHRRSAVGLTLIEVILALGILLGALAALAQLIDTGARAAVQTQLRTQAVLRCESKLAELLAGAEPLQTVAGVEFSDAAEGWTWSAQVQDGPHTDLLFLTVTVTQTDNNGFTNVSYTLQRYLRDPQLFEDAAADAAVSDETVITEE